MKQKLGIAQAIMEHQTIIILDEPYNALDYTTNREITKVLKKLIDLCKKYKIMYLASITTNGFYLSINNIRRLMNYPHQSTIIK